MKRRTKIIWGSIVGAIALAVTVFWFTSDLVHRSDATLESVLANAGQDPIVPQVPSAERDWVVRTVEEATGRRFEIHGAFDAYMLPLPGLLIGRASLSNAAGFGDAPFAEIEGLEVRVGSMSPFKQRIVIERAALAGLRLNLERNAAGVTNWADTSGPQGAASPAAPGDPAAPVAPVEEDDGWSTSVEAIEITDAEISWRDAVTGRYWKLSAFELLASEIVLGQGFPMSVSFAVERDAAAFAIESAMLASTTEDHLRLDELSLSFTDVDPGDLRSLFSSAVVTGGPELVARAGASRTLEFSGMGTFDDTTQELEFSGEVRLADGAVVPVTIGGTFEAPGVNLGSEARLPAGRGD